MSLFRTIKTNTFVLLIMFFLATLLPQKVFAYGFNDYENSTNNQVGTQNLDMTLTSNQSRFEDNSDALYRGDTVSRDVRVNNIGEIPFLFRKEYEFKSGDEILCSVLELVVKYEDEVIYSGLLEDFELYSDEVLEEDVIYEYELTLPETSPYEVSSKKCIFNIKAIAWQEEYLDESEGFWDEEWLENDVSTADWPPVAPEGTTVFNYREDNIGCGSTTNDTQILLDWNDSTAFDLDHYDVEDHDENNVGSPEESELEVDLPDEDGDYGFRVRAVDEGDNEGEWSDWCNITLNTSLSDGEFGEVVINEIMWMGSSVHELDEWIELYNTTDEDINFEGWKLWAGGPAGHEIILSGTIPANGYYLITHYPTDHAKAAINDDIAADLIDDKMHLRDQGEDLLLEDIFGNKIDEVNDSDGWSAGEQGNKGQDKPWKSMERNNDPTTGWHTCTDNICNDGTYWDEDNGEDYGTPKAENRSEEDADKNDDNDEDKQKKDKNKESDPLFIDTSDEESEISTPPEVVIPTKDEDEEDTNKDGNDETTPPENAGGETGDAELLEKPYNYFEI